MTDKAIRCRLTVPHSDFILQNHRVYGISVMPGVTFADILFRILGVRGFDLSRVTLRDIVFPRPLATADHLDREVLVTIEGSEISIASRPMSRGGGVDDWTRHLTGRLTLEAPLEDAGLDVNAWKASSRQVRDMAELYAQARGEAIVHGAPMRCTGRLFLRDSGLLAELELDPSTRAHDGQFHLPPAALDASTLVAFARTPALDAPFIPIALAALRAPVAVAGRFYVHVPSEEQLASSRDVMHNNYTVYDATCRRVAEFTRLTCKRIRDPHAITSLVDGAARQDDRLTRQLRSMVGRALKIAPERVSTTAGFYELGLDSAAMLQISQELEPFVGAPLYPTLLFEHSNIAALARHLEETHGGAGAPPRPDEITAFRRVWRPASPAGDRPLTGGASPAALSLMSRDKRRAQPIAAALRAAGHRVEVDVAGSGTIVVLGSDPARAYDELRAAALAVVERRPTAAVRLLFAASCDGIEIPPEYAALGAVARTLSLETPVLRCSAIAVDAGTDLVSAISRELAADDREHEVRYRAARRELPRFERLALDVGRVAPIADRGAYLVAGGTGQLGRRLADDLIRRYHARLLLVGRRDPDADLAQRIERWRAGGADVAWFRADVTRLDDVRAAVAHARQRHGRLTGVFHLAGEIRDALHFRKDPASAAAVVAPKVQGALHLDRATQDEPLDAFVVFSSLCAVVPNRGQSDYAYANGYLDAWTAWRQRERGGATVAIAWPYWADGGMRVGDAELERERSATGLAPLPTAAGMAALDALLAARESHVIVTCGDAATLVRALVEPAAGGGDARSADGGDVPAAVPAAEVDPPVAEPGPALAATRVVMPVRADDIAIIGLAGCYPQAPDLAAFWQLLDQGRDAITEIPADRWQHEPLYDPARGKRGKTYSRWGGFLDGVDRFAPAFFGISRRDAERMDPQERLFLQTAWHALEDAGYTPEGLAGERVGVFAGVMWSHYQLLDADGVAPTALHSSIANRVSYILGLSGPSLAIDTACSSSLVAIHLAVQSLQCGDATMALVGGVNTTIHPQKYLQLAEDQFLSDDGRCRAFGRGGTGYVPGEGCGVIVLKPLSRALADGDHVEAIIKGSAVNHGSRTSGYTVPDPAAQAAVIREALRRASVAPASITYVEAHGTGTALGDPIEVEGLRQAFADAVPDGWRAAIGSVKSNIGHLESAAGIAGITKVVLQMRHRTLVPTLHAAELNPHIDFASSPFIVQHEPAPWRSPDGEPLRAGVSAFGAGGTNAHVVLESPPAASGSVEPPADQLVVLSAASDDLLRTLARAVLEAIAPAAGSGSPEVAQRCVARLLGVSPSDIDPHATLGELGLDPAELVALRRLLDQAGQTCSAALDRDATVGSLAAAAPAGAAPALTDLAFTLQTGRRALASRLAVVVGDLGALRPALIRFLEHGHPGNRGHLGTVSGDATPDPDCVALFHAGRLDEVARRWVAGAAIDWAACTAGGRHRRISLPVTPLPEERCWLGGWKQRSARDRSPAPGRGVVDHQILPPGIAVITLHDEAHRNMLTDELLRALEQCFAAIAARPDVRVVIVTGTEQVFCMGGTPEALAALAAKTNTFRDAAFVYEGLLRCDLPVIAAIRGHAAGGGLAFGLYADVIVMARDSSCTANFLKYGFTPGMGASYILEHRFGAALAAEMMLTGRTYRGDELERRGAQLLFESADQVIPRALSLGRSIAAMPEDAVRVLKRELASRTLARLATVIQGELAMHERVLGEAAVERVRLHTARSEAEPLPSAQPLATAAASLDRAQVVHRIEAMLCTLLYARSDEIRHDRTFSDMGVDSVGALEIVRDLNQAFGIDLDSVVIYEAPTVSRLADRVLQHRAGDEALRAALAHPSPVAPSPASDSAAPTPGSAPPTPAPALPRPPVALAPPASSMASPAAHSPDPPAPFRVTLAPVARTASIARSAPEVARAEPQPATQRPGLPVEAVAVVGMSGRFPDAPDLDAWWRNLAAGVSSIREIPASRWDVSSVFEADATAEGKTYSRWAAMLTDVDQFDHRFFQLSPREAEEIDPQQRLFLVEAWRALEHAGYAGTAGEGMRCGVFVGCAPGDYVQLLDQAGRRDTGQAFLGNSGSILASRVAYLLDLRGPAVAIDTACSSSLVAVHLACHSLRCGDSDLALAGGVALMLTPSLHVRSSRVGMLSPTGTSTPFSAGADGIVLGEGIGVVVLKRLADAQRDGDRIYGVILASGVNGDGRTNGITAPSATAQAALLRRVHTEAGVTLRDITYVEAHGTGTALGDPIEFRALAQVFGADTDERNFCGLGSVKGNVGHTTMTAGVAGLLKVLLALHHGQLPPTPGFTSANPRIDFEASPFFMTDRLRDWIPGRAGRIAGISSFGFSGTNCHVVVAQPPPEPPRTLEPRPEVVPVSARTEAELDAQLRRLADALTPQHAIPDVAFTLATGRRHLTARAAVVASDVAELRRRLLALAAGEVTAGTWRAVVAPAAAELPAEASVAPGADPARCAAAYVEGAAIDWRARFYGRPVRRVALPTYPFSDTRHWVTVAPSPARPCRALDPDEPLIADHQVDGRRVLAGAASVELVVATAQRSGLRLPLRLGRLRWVRPQVVEARTVLDIEVGDGSFRTGDAAEPHSTGTIEALAMAAPRVDLAAMRTRCTRPADVAALYRSFEAAGLRYGATFRLLRSIAVGEDRALATLAASSASLAATVPAAVLDGAFQSAAVLVDADDTTTLVPVGVRTLDIFDSLTTAVHAVVHRRAGDQFDIDVTNAAGDVLVHVGGLVLRPMPRIERKVFIPVWRPAPPPASAPHAIARAAVVHPAAMTALAGALRRAMSPAETRFVPYGDDGAADLAALRSAFDRIYFIASTDAGPSPSRDVSVLFRVVHELLAGGRDRAPLSLHVVTCGAVATAADEPLRPHAAALLGLIRSVAAEYPQWRAGAVDLGQLDPGGTELDEAARRVVAEDGAARLIALRGERRLIRGVAPAVLPPPAERFRRRGAYVVLGGASGIGYALSLYLARRYAARVAWIGRSAEDAEIRNRIAAVSRASGEAIYLQADATVVAQLTAAVGEARRRFGAIHGAVHSAGVMRDRMLANMTPADLDDVLAVKLVGSMNFRDALAGEALDFLVLFSSAAALIDSAGQAAYAAASTFEDAYAAQLRRAGLPSTVVDWGYWGSVGAVANSYHRRVLAADGIGSLEPEVAFAALERILGMEQALVIEATPAGLRHFGFAESVAPALRPQDAAAYVRRVFAEVLKFGEDELDDRSTFEQFGIDSVVGSQIVARLGRDLGGLPSTLLFEEMTIERLANRLLADRPTELAAALALSVRPIAEAPGAGAPPPPHAPIDAMRDDGVAVIGVVGHYPGAPDLAAFWRNLAAGVSSIGEVPPERWDWRRGADVKQGPQSWQRWGGFLDDVAGFDAALFGVLPRDAANIDPQERLFLEACWSLLEQTGYLGLSHEAETGVFAGLMYGTYGEIAAQAWPVGELSGAHSAYWSVANRVSYTFDLHGPSLAVDTACSSSLTAVHLACESLRRGDCRMAIAGGVNLVLHPAHLASLGARNMLAPDGVAKVFDAAANGYVPGEGVGAVLLKPLTAAIADGDDVWAVIRGGAWNAGGKTSGYTVPNPNAQAHLVETALRRARVEPHTISYVEAHGTGTELGDPIELAALARALRGDRDRGARCAFGSVKSNIGHLEGAAGIAGLTKVLLQLRHHQLAPTLHLTTLNPKIDLRGTPFVPQTALTPWPGERGPRRAGVSSFGAGGANVHLVVEEWPAERRSAFPAQGEHVVVLSAPTCDRLAVLAEAVAGFVEAAPAELRLADLAYTSQLGRRAFDHRLAVAATSLAELAAGLLSGAAREAADPALRALVSRWLAGEPVDWRAVWPVPAHRVAFPGIPLDRRPYWLRGASSAPPETQVRYERAVWAPARLTGETRLVHRALVVSDDRTLAAAVQRRLSDAGIAIADSTAALPDAIVHIGAGELEGSAPDRPFHDVFGLAVGLLRRTPRAPLRLVCARVVRPEQEQPHLVALAALIRTLAQEDRRCTGVCIALDAGPHDALAARIVDELRAGGGDLEVSWRDGTRSVRTLQPFVPGAPATDYVAGDATYLITGGAGALGIHFAGLLAERGAGEVVLLGRSRQDERIAARLAELRRARARIRYERADVTLAGELERVVAELRRTAGPLRGVIHAAGAIRDARAVNKTPEQIAAVLGPKIAGVLNLDRVTAGDPLDFFVVFSSLVGQVGNPGQADYAYANAFLDAFAETRQRWCAAGARRGRTLSIGWPLWRDGGMRVDDAIARLLERRWGMVPMATHRGRTAFEVLLAGSEPAALVLEVTAERMASADPAVHTGSPPHTAPIEPAVAAERSAVAAPVEPAVAAERSAVIAPAGPVGDRLRALAAEFLLVDAAEVDVHTALLDLGFDSISMTELIERINAIYGLALRVTVLFECPTLAEVIAHIERTRSEPAAPGDARAPAPRAVTDIAVIGMAGRLPGSADLDEFWAHLVAGHDLVRPVPPDRDDLLAEPRTRDMRGGFLYDIAAFDATLFGIAPREAALMDPQQRLFLQAVWSAIADAGYRSSDLAGTATGVFAGVSTSDYDDLLTRHGVPVQGHTATGIAHAVLANRVSYRFHLCGPSEAIDTACSSSLVAVHRAVRALRAGECEIAIAGGVNVTLTPGLFVAFAESGMLSADGRCRTFDRGASGYVRGEGVGVVILKRLDHALADGDRVHAVIKGSAVNHGGRAASLTAPNPRAQAAVLRAAYADAGVDIASVGYIEAHGTGTRLGDPVEIEGIMLALGPGGAPGSIAIGSVKTNIGHLESAAGIAGLLKTVLAIRHGALPPHLHFEALNPHIELEGTPLRINDRLCPWPPAQRRAGVSSFGFGGANAHVVVEAAPVARPRVLQGPLVFPLSAPDAPRLAAYAAGLAARLEAEPDLDLHAVAYVLQTGRDDQRERLVVVARSRDELIANLRNPELGRQRGGADALATAWLSGDSVDWRAHWPTPPCRVSLPTFPLARTRHWLPGAASGEHAADTTSGIADLVRAQLGELLSIDPARIAGDSRFQDLGLDSMFAMDLAERLRNTTGIEVQAATLYDRDTVDALIAFMEVARNGGPSPEAAVASLITAVLRRPVDPRCSFADGDLTSIDMLRVIGELERGLGALPKTLLFDYPDLPALSSQLCALYGAEAVRRLRANGGDAAVVPAGEATITSKREVPAGSPLDRLLRDLSRQHGVESGLAGRDIAPLVFVASDEHGYVELSRSADRLLVWSYTGPSTGFAAILEEILAYGRVHHLRVSVLSPVRLEQVGSSAFTATPFGVVQHLEDLAAFTLEGSERQRLRGMVRRFGRAGAVAVAEYIPGSDPSIDGQLVAVVDRWAAGKPVVNPYAHTIREDLRRGALAADHRVFVTSVDGIIRAAVIVTRMASQPGYLLDAEFYGDDMPAGGLEYTIVRIIEVLRAEGITTFSFGATFGVKVCDSPNASLEAERALDELRSAGMLGRGNYQFKRKFGPDELPIYLCQPIDQLTSVADILVMIGSPEPASRSPLQRAYREVAIDLLTDSWAERDDPWIAERMRGLDRVAAGAGDSIEQAWLPFTCVLPTPSGRTAEALLCRSWPGRRGRVLHNGLFPTWLFSLAEQRFTPVALPRLDEGTVLDDAIARDGDGVSFVVVELSCNAAGGRPISLAGLQRVAAAARARGVPLVLDATRLVENAVAIAESEGRDVWEVARELLALGDAATLSLSKDWGVNFGGLVASRIPELDSRLREEAALRGTDVGLASRRLLQVALGDLDAVLEQVRRRMAAVRALAQQLIDVGLPVVIPVGGHCVLVDVERIPGHAGDPNEFLTQVFERTGVRGGPHLGGDAYPELRSCCRLAVPIGMTVEAAERAGALVAGTRGAPAAPEAWFSRQLRELGTTLTSTSYAPANQNLDVIREMVPAIECRMVGVPGGEVEVFSAGAGPTLLLMQPFNIGAGIFAPMFAALSDRFRMIVIHQPGVGRTRAAGSLSLDGIASLQRRVLSAIGVDEPIHVGGASVGAIFAQYFALRFPELTLSLSLLGGSYRFANRKGQIDRLEQVIAEDFDAIAMGSGQPYTAEDRDRFTRFLLRCESMDSQTGLRYLDLFAKEPALAPRLAEISAPTLILQGRHDSVVGIKTGHFLHGAIPEARYIELPRSGHFVCVTDADAVNRELAAFLDEIVVTSTPERTRRAGPR